MTVSRHTRDADAHVVVDLEQLLLVLRGAGDLLLVGFLIKS